LDRHPRLADDTADVLALFEAELAVLRRRDPTLRLEAYLEQVPRYRQALEGCAAGRGLPPDDEVLTVRLGPAPRPHPTQTDPALAPRCGPTPASPPGYELLEVVGRGSMGVVYKAWQSRLSRVVAVKMLRLGAHASADEWKRFRVEAEALARLQHPAV